MRPTVRSTVQRALRVAANLATLMLVLPLRASERVLFRFSRVGHTGGLDPAQFAWTRVLETHWREIRAELDVVLADEHPFIEQERRRRNDEADLPPRTTVTALFKSVYATY